MPYTHFTLEERKYLQKLLEEGLSGNKIAAALGRSPSSISRELKRNSSKNPKKPTNRANYHHWRAHSLAMMRRRDHRRTALPPESFKRDYVCRGLSLFWSPEQIANRLREDFPGQIVGTSTIYRYLRRGDLPGFSRKTHLRRRGKRKVNRSSNYNTIQPDRTVLEWPAEIAQRTVIGHFEGDSVLGKPGTGGILTFVDRASRYLFAAKIDSKAAEPTRKAIVKLLKDVKVRSITLDNGCEFAQFRQIEEKLDTLVYFAEPHKPWQRGTNENTNGLLRFFFPKGCDFRAVSQEALDSVVDLINSRPRKCLGWKTPKDVFAGVALRMITYRLPFQGPIPPIRGKCPEGTKGVGMLSAKQTERSSQICCNLSVSASPSHLP